VTLSIAGGNENVKETQPPSGLNNPLKAKNPDWFLKPVRINYLKTIFSSYL
jgi:hypothetical protein